MRISDWSSDVCSSDLIYANYAVAQQPPGGASLELSSRENNANNPIFDPQKAKTDEIGTKWQLFGDGLLLTATMYDTRVSNKSVQDPTEQPSIQSGEKRVRGVRPEEQTADPHALLR